jgi:hypothetical protein
MRAAIRSTGILLVALAVAGALGGCLGSMVGAVAAPELMAASAVSGAGSRTLGLGAADPVSDLDRIIATHPDAGNRDELSALRDDLLQQGHGGGGSGAASGSAEIDEFDRHAPPGRRRRGDRPRLAQPIATGERTGADQREEPVPFATARTSALPPNVRRWYDIPITPIRIGPMPGEDRRANRRD